MKRPERKRYMSLTNEQLLREIDQKYKVLAEQPEYRMFLIKGVDASLRYLSDLAAWINQNPQLRAEIECELDGRTNHREIALASRDCARRVGNAWSYLRGAVDYSRKSTDQLLSPNLITQIAKIIDESNEDYRRHNEKAESFYPDYEPPHSGQVPVLMEEFCRSLRESKAHPIDKAAFSHVAITAIQPFRAAHKRLGRLIQDSILLDHLLPTATIFPGERATYYDLLRAAVIGYSTADSKLKVPFFNYIAGKVNVKLDTVVTCLFGSEEDRARMNRKNHSSKKS